MSEQIYYLAYLTEPREVGVPTPHSPQHLTLVPPFKASNPESIIKATKRAAGSFSLFPIRISGEDYFGPDQNINVYKVEPRSVVMALHKALLEELEKVGINTKHLNHIGDEFMPHITIKPQHETWQQDKVLKLDHIGVLEKTDKERTLIARIPLVEK